MRTLLPLVTLSLVGCPGRTLDMDSGLLALEAEGVTAGVYTSLTRDLPVHEDTLLCGQVRSRACEEECPDLRSCLETRVTGAGQAEEGCLRTRGSGAVTWSFDSVCADVPSDQLTLQVVSAGEVQGRLARPQVELILAELEADPGAWTVVGDADLTDALPEPGGTVRVVAQRDVQVHAALDADGVPVMFGEDVQVSVVGGSTRDDDGTLVLRAPAGGAGEVWLLGEEHEHLAGTWEAVSREDLASLDIAAAVDSEGVLAGLVAVVRDRDGEPLYRPPVRWRVMEGAPIALDHAVTDDVVWAWDECLPPEDRAPGRRTLVEAWIRGGPRDQLWVEYDTTTFVDDDDVEFTPHDDCPGATCGCATGSTGAGAWLVPVVLGMLRRRRTR